MLAFPISRHHEYIGFLSMHLRRQEIERIEKLEDLGILRLAK
jgi:hypothetical protein